MPQHFDHEKLIVYQESLAFVRWTKAILERVQKSFAAHDQLDRAATSIPLNIAEGNGKFTPADRCRYFDNARGSALECAAALDVLMAKGKMSQADVAEGKQILQRIVAMLVGLIKTTSPQRLYEKSAEYETGGEGRGRAGVEKD